MHKVQKTYTQEFKREAVRLAQTSGKPITHVARELGISDTSIHQWRKELAEHGSEAFPGSGHQTALEEENRRLKRELERTRQERDILKKPSGQRNRLSSRGPAIFEGGKQGLANVPKAKAGELLMVSTARLPS
jgi:transposase